MVLCRSHNTIVNTDANYVTIITISGYHCITAKVI